jgi:hypothetical protein
MEKNEKLEINFSVEFNHNEKIKVFDFHEDKNEFIKPAFSQLQMLA